MSEVKWIKITTDMFDNRKIKAIRKLPEGNNIILIWVMLLSLAGRCNASGKIFLTEHIPYTNKMLADELGFDESVICISLNTLQKFGMITREENFLISINNWSEYQSVDGMERIREQNRLRNIEYRKRKKEVKGIEEKRDDKKKKSSKTESNISNLNLLLESGKNDYQYLLNNEELLNSVKEWMEYKDQKKPKNSNTYAEKGMDRFLKKAIKEAKEHGIDSVVEVINDSISNNYVGVTWDRLEKGSAKNDFRRKTGTNKGYIQRIVESGNEEFW